MRKRLQYLMKSGVDGGVVAFVAHAEISGLFGGSGDSPRSIIMMPSVRPFGRKPIPLPKVDL